MHPHERAAQEIARRGREIYERDIRHEVEPGGANDGAFLVVDVETGAYFLGETTDAAWLRARTENPQGLFYLMRVGRPAAHRIGSAGAPSPMGSSA